MSDVTDVLGALMVPGDLLDGVLREIERGRSDTEKRVAAHLSGLAEDASLEEIKEDSEAVLTAMRLAIRAIELHSGRLIDKVTGDVRVYHAERRGFFFGAFDALEAAHGRLVQRMKRHNDILKRRLDELRRGNAEKAAEIEHLERLFQERSRAILERSPVHLARPN